MRRQEKDAERFPDTCIHCGVGMEIGAIKCPNSNCRRWSPAGIKIMALSVVAIVLFASMGGLLYLYLRPGQLPGEDPGPGGGGDNGGGTTGKRYMVIGTNLGQIKVELDTANAPNTTAHMMNIVNSGTYSSGAGSFYRAEPGFVIQGGTQSGSSQNVAWEDTGLLNSKYTISMARSGSPDSASDSGTGSSEFFINLNANTNLDSYAYPYVVFGKVVAGFSVVDQIATGATTSNNGIMYLNDPIEFTSVAITES